MKRAKLHYIYILAYLVQDRGLISSFGDGSDGWFGISSLVESTDIFLLPLTMISRAVEYDVKEHVQLDWIKR